MSAVNDKIMITKQEVIDPLKVPKSIDAIKEMFEFKDKQIFCLTEKIKELIIFTEVDGTVVNGFRTKEIIKDLRELVA